MPSFSSLQLNDNRGWRGGERQTLLLARALHEKGNPVAVVTHPRGELYERAQRAGLDVIPIVGRGELSMSAVRQLRNAILDRKPDVVHAHTPHTQSHALLARFSGSVSCPLVVSRRVDKSIHRLPLRLSGLKYRYGVDRYIAISNAVRERLLSDGVAGNKIGRVFDGVEPHVADETVPARLGTIVGDRPEGPCIMTVAALDRSKGHHVILEAAARIRERYPHASFVFVGEGPERAHLEGEVAKRGLRESVVFTGYRTDVLELICACDVFVMASLSEGLCTSVMDAMFLRRPVVVSRVGGMPELIEDGERGRVTAPENAAELADAVLETLDCPERARARVANARDWAMEHVTVDAMLEGTLREYAIALGR